MTMPCEVLKSSGKDSILQFSVFLPNGIGHLHRMISVLDVQGVHVLALCILDNKECSVVRFIVNYPDLARDILKKNGFSFRETPVLGIETDSLLQLKTITGLFSQMELSIHYTYALFRRPQGKVGLIFSVEDNELASKMLQKSGIAILTQADIAR